MHIFLEIIMFEVHFLLCRVLKILFPHGVLHRKGKFVHQLPKDKGRYKTKCGRRLWFGIARIGGGV